MNHNSLNKTALVVGGTSGIGRASAIKLARRGFDVMVIGRNRQAGAEVVNAIERAGVRGTFVHGDVSLMRDVRRMADEVRRHTSAISVLIHCTDVILNKRVETAEGVELSFATNFLSRFFLNDLLLDLLEAGATSRIVHVAAPGMPFRINLDHVPPPRQVSSFSGHNIGQGANNLYGIELAARLAGTGVSINVMNPGLVDTDIRRRSPDMPPAMRIMGGLIERLLKSRTVTAEQCADVVLRVALSPETAAWNGQLIGHTGKQLKIYAHDADPQRRKVLWERSTHAVAQALAHSAQPAQGEGRVTSRSVETDIEKPLTQPEKSI